MRVLMYVLNKIFPAYNIHIWIIYVFLYFHFHIKLYISKMHFRILWYKLHSFFLN